MAMSQRIVHTTTVEVHNPNIDGMGVLTDLEIRYDCADPWAVTFAFCDHRSTWVFARSLLTEALLSGKAGHGDVQFGPTGVFGSTIWLTLSSPTGVAYIELPVEDITTAYAAINALVPEGHEDQHLDFDYEFIRMLPGVN